MMLFAVGVERELDMPVQRPRDSDPCEHCRAAQRRDEHQRFNCGLPFRRE